MKLKCKPNIDWQRLALTVIQAEQIKSCAWRENTSQAIQNGPLSDKGLSCGFFSEE